MAARRDRVPNRAVPVRRLRADGRTGSRRGGHRRPRGRGPQPDGQAAHHPHPGLSGRAGDERAAAVPDPRAHVFLRETLGRGAPRRGGRRGSRHARGRPGQTRGRRPHRRDRRRSHLRFLADAAPSGPVRPRRGAAAHHRGARPEPRARRPGDRAAGLVRDPLDAPLRYPELQDGLRGVVPGARCRRDGPRDPRRAGRAAHDRPRAEGERPGGATLRGPARRAGGRPRGHPGHARGRAHDAERPPP